jgi:hypothetical protein
MWIELAIVAVIALSVLGLFIYAKVLSFKLKEANTKAQVATDSLKSAEQVIKQKDKTEQAVRTVQTERSEKHRSAQARIDAGERNDFDTEDF